MIHALALTLLLAAGAPADATLAPASADRGAVSAALEGVDARPQEPEWTDYLGVIVTAGVRWLWDQLPSMRGLFRFGPRAALSFAWAFIAIGFLAVVLIVAWYTAGRRSRPAVGDSAVPSPAPPPAPPPRDWLVELERRLEAGDVTGALEALWWIFARAVSREEVRAAWTSGELVARARRPDLMPLAVQLDRFRYGPRRPLPADVRRLAEQLAAPAAPAEARA
jgi:hypothetical protein